MKLRRKRLFVLILIVIIMIVVISLAVFKDKPLVCTKVITLDNGVKVTDKVTINYKNKEISLIKVNKEINIDEHAYSSYTDVFKKQLENAYPYITDKNIYDKDRIVYMDGVITKGGYIIDGFNVSLVSNVMTVNSVSDIDVAPVSIRIGETYDKKVRTKLTNASYECE